MSIRLFPDQTQDQPYLPVGCVEKILEFLPGLALSALRMCSHSGKQAVDAQLWRIWKSTLTRLEVNTSIINRSSGELARRIFPLMKRITDNTQPILRKFWELNCVIHRVCTKQLGKNDFFDQFYYRIWRDHDLQGLPTWEDLRVFTSDAFDYVQEDARIRQLRHKLEQADSRDALKQALESSFSCQTHVWPVVVALAIHCLLYRPCAGGIIARGSGDIIYLKAWVLRFLSMGHLRDWDRFYMIDVLCQNEASTGCLEVIQALYNFNQNSLDRLNQFVRAAAGNPVSLPIITWLLEQGYVDWETRQSAAWRALKKGNCESAIQLLNGRMPMDRGEFLIEAAGHTGAVALIDLFIASSYKITPLVLFQALQRAVVLGAPGLPIVQRLLTMGSFVSDRSDDVLARFLQHPKRLRGYLQPIIAQAIDASWDSRVVATIDCLLASISDAWDRDQYRAVVVIIASQSARQWSLIDDLLHNWGPVADEAAALAAANVLWHVPDVVALPTVNLLLNRKFHEVVAAKDYIMHHHPKWASNIALHQRPANAVNLRFY